MTLPGTHVGILIWTARRSCLIQQPVPAPMLVFDADCGFCDRVVRLILAREVRHDLLFVPRSSPLGRRLREQYGLQQVESLLWIEDGRAYSEWQAVSRTAGYLGGSYARLARLANLLPEVLINGGYRMAARIRKRLARPPRNCQLLTAAQQARFLE
jgi:predicted DCC family thiol-disulfide oxidoreductase YuxK